MASAGIHFRVRWDYDGRACLDIPPKEFLPKEDHDESIRLCGRVMYRLFRGDELPCRRRWISGR